MAASTDVGHALMRGVAVSLRLEASYFAARYTGDPLVLFRIFHYPPVVHFGTGLAFGLVRAPFVHSLAAAVAYEVVEQVVERHGVGQELFHVSRPETPLNAVTDVAVFALGHALGAMWNRT